MQTLKTAAIIGIVVAYVAYLFSGIQPKDGVILSIITNAILALALGRRK